MLAISRLRDTTKDEPPVRENLLYFVDFGLEIRNGGIRQSRLAFDHKQAVIGRDQSIRFELEQLTCRNISQS